MKLARIATTELITENEIKWQPRIPTYDEFNPILPKGYRPNYLAVDTETTGLRWSVSDRPFGLSLGWFDQKDNVKTTYYDWPVDPFTRQPNYHGQKGLCRFTSLYCDPEVVKVFANAKYDIHMIYRAFGLMPKGRIEDVLIAAWCCNTLESSYKLNDLAEKYCGIPQDETKLLREHVQKARNQAKNKDYKIGPGLSTIPEDYWLLKVLDPNNDLCEIYARKDAERTISLWFFYLEAMKELGVYDSYNIEIEVLHHIYRMEQRGIRFDEDVCIEKIDELQRICTEKEHFIKNFFSNPNLNINSDKQLIPYFYDFPLHLPVIELTSGGKSGKQQPSMSSETLKKLLIESNGQSSEVIQALLDYRGHNTGIKYFKNYLEYAVKDEYVTPNDLPFLHQKKAIHPNFNQIAVWGDYENKTRTGRLSSSNPNLQNVADPEKSGAVVDGRMVFTPRDGYVFYCIDYSQLELRIFAERTGGKLKDAFLSGRDPHDETRTNVPYLAAMEAGKGRKIAKNTNFTIINCGGAGVLHKKYGVPLDEGKIVVKEFYENFPETTIRQRDASTFAIENGYIETITGRKINVDLAQKYGKYIYAYRATSYDIQGSAADIIKRAMIQCSNFLKQTKYDAHLILSIHDELVFEIAKKHAYKKLILALKTIMENVVSDCMSIPLICEVQKTYTNWSTKAKQDVIL